MYIANVFCVCYNVCRLNVMSCFHSGRQQETPVGLSTDGGFFLDFMRSFLTWVVLSLISIQPFANVVRNYTSYDRKYECYGYFHSGIPPFWFARPGVAT